MVMLQKNFVELHSLMLHAKFQNKRPSVSEEDFKGLNLGHVTLTIYTSFHSPFLTVFHIKFGFNWLSGFRKEDV